jgi:hypothetical protein
MGGRAAAAAESRSETGEKGVIPGRFQAFWRGSAGNLARRLIQLGPERRDNYQSADRKRVFGAVTTQAGVNAGRGQVVSWPRYHLRGAGTRPRGARPARVDLPGDEGEWPQHRARSACRARRARCRPLVGEKVLAALLAPLQAS